MIKNKESNDIGTVIGAVIIVLVLLTGAVFFYLKNLERQKNFKALLESARQTATIQGDNVIYEEVVN